MSLFESKTARREAKLAGESFYSLNPARTFEDNLLVNIDGSFGVGFRCQFPNLFMASAASRQKVFLSLRTALNILGDEYDVQVIFDDHGRHDDFLGEIQGKAEEGNLLADYAHEQSEQLKAGFESGQLRWMVGYICLVRLNPFPPGHFRQRATPASASQLVKLFHSVRNSFGAGELQIKYTEAEWERLKGDFCATADSFYSELSNAGFTPTVLDCDGALELLYSYWNPHSYDQGGRPRAFSYAEDLPLPAYFLTSAPAWDRDTGVFKLDSIYGIVATVETPPERTRFSQYQNTLLPAGTRGVRLVVTLRHTSLEQRVKTVTERLPELEALAKKNPFYEAQFRDADRELRELGKGLEKAWLAQQVFIVRGNSPEEVRRRYADLRKFGEVTHGLKITAEIHAVIDYLVAAQPFWTRDRDPYRLIPFSTSQAATQIPAVGQPPLLIDGTGRKGRVGAIHETSTGGLVNFFLHDDTLFSNYNAFVIGSSGKGKGVLMNDYIAQMRMRHPCRFVVIDADIRSKGGGSYRRTAECLDGSYLDFDLTTKGRVSNPFYTERNHFPDQDELDAMTSSVERYLVPENQKRLEPHELAGIEATIKQLFHNAQGKREVTLSDLRKLIGETESCRHLAARLGRWTGDGAYANLADGSNGHDISKWLTVFNLTRIKENKVVCPIVFANIFATVAQLASRYPNELKVVIFDECADFLKDPIIAAYIEKCYRQMRKAGVAVIGMSQSIEEFLATESRTGFVNNVDHLLLLQQNSTVAEMVRDTFGLSEAEFQAILELKSDPGNFSQVMIRHKLGDGSVVSDVVIKRPTPLGYAMATTNPRDHEVFNQLRGSGLSYKDAVRRFAALYPNGVSRGTPKPESLAA